MMSPDGKPSVFIDTNVVASYLTGEPSSSQLFSSEILSRIHAAINPTVLQELFSLEETQQHPDMLNELQEEVRVLTINLEKAEEYLEHAAGLRNRIAHSNDVLILSSAADCDYLVTYDRALGKTLSELSTNKPKVVTPEQLISQLKSKV